MSAVRKARELLLKRPGEKPERIHLGVELKSGGAGSVHSIQDDTTRVIKLYHAETLVSEGSTYQEKIECMLGNVPTVSDISSESGAIVQLAWPLASAYNLKDEFVGFAMPMVDMQRTTELEFILSPKQARKSGLPHNLAVNILLACNLASVVKSIHAQKHAIVDLKPNNLKFYMQELYVAVLDCDGFYVTLPGKTSAAPQVTPDYLAPEFHGASITKPEHQDQFALAVIIFKLLNFDTHPYAGVPKEGEHIPSEQAEKIKDGLYPYGAVPHKKVSPVPASVHETFPGELRALFDRAFGKSPSLRPTAAEWTETLRNFAQRSQGLLDRCKSQHWHFRGMPCATCLREQIVGQASRQQHLRKTPLPLSAQSVAPKKSFPEKVFLIWIVSSLMAGFFIGIKFWLASFIIAVLLYIIFGKKLGSGMDRIGGAVMGGIAFSGLIFMLLWMGGLFLQDENPSVAKVSVENESSIVQDERPAMIQPSAMEEFLTAMGTGDLGVTMGTGDLGIANQKFPLAVAEHLANNNPSKDSYSKLLTSALDLVKRNMAENRKGDAEIVLFSIYGKLLNPQVVAAQSSSLSKQVEFRIASMVADLFWSQKNYQEAITAARISTSTKLFAVDKETDLSINNAHLVLAKSLLMTHQSKEAAKEFGDVRVVLLPESDRLLARMMQLVAGTQADQYEDPEAEARKQLANYKDEEMRVVLQSIKELAGGSPEIDEIAKVAERLVEAKIRGPSIFEKASSALSGLFNKESKGESHGVSAK